MTNTKPETAVVHGRSGAIIGQAERGPIAINVQRLVETRLIMQANSGGGKSYAIRRLLEQTHGLVQHIVIDLEDEFHTLREKFDYVLAGRDGGDCPADLRSAVLLARRLRELQVSAIIGISELKAHERILFVKRFLDSLIEVPRSLWHPCLVIVDESHVFCPQNGSAESAGAVIDLMTRGRKRGLAGVLATQRISKLHKDAAAEANNKLIGRSALDVDMKRAADELGFSGRDEQNRLRTLKEGEFFCFGPAFSDTVTFIKVGNVETTHPRAGQRLAVVPAPPREAVQKILAQLSDLPHEAAEEAKTIEGLKAELANARRELTRAKSTRPAAQVVTQPVVDQAAIDRAVKQMTYSMRRTHEQQMRPIKSFLATVRKINEQLGASIPEWPETPEAPQLDRMSQSSRADIPPRIVKREARPARRSERTGDVTIPKGERAILTACAQYPDGCAKDQLTILTGYKRSSRDAYIQRLREKGFVTDDGVVVATDEGIAALGDFEPLPTGAELQEYWINRLPEGERKVLEVLIEAYPESVTREAIDEATDYKRSSRDAYIQRLKARRLVTIEGRGEVKAAEDLKQ